MTPASYRHAFFDVLQELSALSSGEPGDDSALWSAQYLSRGATLYHFNGFHDEGKCVARGLAFDTLSGHVHDMHPDMLTLIFLDFQNNAVIGAYAGEKRLSTQIAADLLPGLARTPELLGVSIERERRLECGSMLRESTAFVFVGFEQLCDAADISNGKRLASSPDMLSSYWCRGRTRIMAVGGGSRMGATNHR